MAGIGISRAERFGVRGGRRNFALFKLKSNVMVMNHSMIVWCVIAGVLFAAFLFRAVERYLTECRRDERPRPRLFDIGREKDIFYAPGDADEDDDFEDL